MTAPSDPNRLAWKQPEADQVWAKVRKDKPLTKRLSSDVISAGNLPGQASESPSASPSDSPSESPSESSSASPSTSPDDEASAQALADAGLCT